MSVGIAAFSALGMAQSSAAPTQDDKAMHEKHGGRGHDGMRGGGMHHGMGMMRGLHDLNLSDAQKAQIKVIMDANRPTEGSMQEMKTLMTAKRDGTITPEQKERLKAIRGEQKSKMELVHTQIMAILTPEQRATMDAKRKEMKDRREERRQNRDGSKAAKPDVN